MTCVWILIPLISAGIGWFASRLPLVVLFHPRKPKKLFGFTIQGIFPKKQRELAESLGKLLPDAFFSFGDIEEKITHPENFRKIIPAVEAHIDEFLRVKLPAQMPVIGMFIGDRTIGELKAVFMTELETLFPIVMKSYMHNLEAGLDLEKIITERLMHFSPVRLEKIIYASFSKQLRILSMTAALMGFLAGLVQVLLMYLW